MVFLLAPLSHFSRQIFCGSDPSWKREAHVLPIWILSPWPALSLHNLPGREEIPPATATLLFLGTLLGDTEVVVCHWLLPPPEHPGVCDRPWAAQAPSGQRYRGAAGVSGWGSVSLRLSLGNITPASCQTAIISSWAEAAYNMNIQKYSAGSPGAVPALPADGGFAVSV